MPNKHVPLHAFLGFLFSPFKSSQFFTQEVGQLQLFQNKFTLPLVLLQGFQERKCGVHSHLLAEHLPDRVRKWKIPGRVTRPAHRKSTLGTTDPRWLRPTPTPPSRPSESPGSPIQISVVLFPSSQWQALLWEATLSRVEP